MLETIVRVPASERSRRWRVAHSWWVGLIVIGFGALTWIAFAYVGVRTRRLRWIRWAAIYTAVLVASVYLVDLPGETWRTDVGVAGLLVFCWLGGIGHGVGIRSDILDVVSSRSDPPRERGGSSLIDLERPGALAGTTLGSPIGQDDFAVDANWGSPIGEYDFAVDTTEATLFPARGNLQLRIVADLAFGLMWFVLGIGMLGYALFGHVGWAGLLTALFGLFLGSAGVGAFASARQHSRMLRSRLPLLRIDVNGLECARGWVNWTDVDELRLHNDPDDRNSHTELVVSLKPDAPSLIGATGYAADGVSFDPPKLTIPLFGVKEGQARDFVKRFWSSGIE